MKRNEAVTCLKEILLRSDVLPEIFSIFGSDDSVNEGFKIKIYANMDEEFRRKINSITKNFGLSVIELENQVIIYKKEFNGYLKLVSTAVT